MSVQTTLIWNKPPRFLTGRAHELAIKAVRATAFAIQGDAESTASVDTGFMKNSICVKTQTEDTSDKRKSRAFGRLKGASREWLDAPPVESPTQAIVYVAAEYAIYVNDGTSTQPGTFFFTFAVDKQRSQFADRMASIFRDQL